MSDDSILCGGNAEFLAALYEAYQTDRGRMAPSWRNYFDSLEAAPSGHARPAGKAPTAYRADLAGKQVSVLQFINAYRFRGHRQANLDPLNLYERPAVPDMEIEYHGLSEADLDETFNSGSLVGPPEATLREIRDVLRATYCGSIGAEYMYLTSTDEKRWVQERIEGPRGTPTFTPEKRRDILKWLTASRKLEEFLHKKYVGQKRFSLEGGESLIPLLNEIIQSAGEKSVKEIVIGMAHRGRLNVLVNAFGKHPKVLFGEFEGKIDVGTGSGDVKYHLGFSSNVETPGGPVHLVLAFNPSHLEIINPVVEGSVRARQERREDHERNHVLPVLIHGDAAFAGQGVVMETLNLSETRGYGTGGTVHVVINNQIGFTTSDPLDSRSTLYCTDVAKMVQAPIFHVNGHDPEAVIFVTQIALEFRMQFNKDVVIDVVCYRRHGHNEADEPLVTQPMMYKKIREQKGVRRTYAERLVADGVLPEGGADQMSQDYLEALEANEVVSSPILEDLEGEHLLDWSPYIGGHWSDPVQTAVSLETVESLGLKLCHYPKDFELHRIVRKLVDGRTEMARGERRMDWGFAECLAYATLLQEGYSVRLSGQDSERGTFAHRHANLHDQKGNGYHKPLSNLFPGQPRFRVINSLLSEEAVLAFEYGYSTAEPHCLVVWEAQFGDFANGAQVVIDQFLSSSEAKWGRYCGLVMLLPHGFEGQGPEHSSARLERYLQLCAEENIQVCMPSTPAQMFHMLRRQMLRRCRLPLIVMTPKSLLRHRLSTSTREELCHGEFQLLIDEVDPIKPRDVTRLVLCSGKVYYDLLEKRREHQLAHIAIARVEQLYPFPEAQIKTLLDQRYPKANEIVWVQEEPRNQGSWFHMLSRRHLAGLIKPRHSLIYAGRHYSASPASGHLNVHLAEQRALVESALALDQVDVAQKTA